MAIVNGKDYNGNDFDLLLNPFGFGAGGHKEVVSPATDPNYIALALDIIADGTNSLQTTSTTTNTIAIGSTSWTMDAVRPFQAGQRVRMINLDDTTEFMTGIVTSFTISTLVLIINISIATGSGSSSNWKSTLDGEVGLDGTFDIDVLSAETPVNDDTFGFFDDSGGTNKKVGFDVLLAQIAFYRSIDF